MATITGTPNADTLTGTDPNLNGADGADIIHGGGGNDRIDGLGGVNQIYGDEGDDVIILTRSPNSPAPGVFDIASTIDGGTGTDTLDMRGNVQAILVQETSPGNGVFTVRYSTGVLMSNLLVESGTSIEKFILGPVNSALLLPNWATPLYVQSSVGNSRISTGTADDTIVAGANGDVIILNGGNDVVIGGAGSSYVTIGRISGNADRIQITGGAGQTDTLAFENASVTGEELAVDLASGVATLGTTRIGFSGIEHVQLDGSPATATIYGDDGQNQINAQNSGTGIAAHGRGGIDIITGSAGSDTLSGDDGDDYVYGGSGNDQLLGGAGDDHILGGDGSNRIEGGDGHDWLQGNAEGNGQPGSDTILGGAGNDHIWGYAQDAAASTGAGDQGDSIDGGDGADYVNGNAGNDTIFGGAGMDRLLGGAGDDSIDGGDGPDQINGNRGNDTITGGEGNDVLRGGQGDDDLTGGSGNDNLLGDLGNDTLRAGAGVDIMTGGDGADRFDLSATGAASIDPSGYFTTILDFAHGTDSLKLAFTPTASDVLHSAESFTTTAAAMTAAQGLLSAHAGTTDVAVLQVGGDSYLFYNAAGTGDAVTSVVVLSNVSAASIGSGDFV